MGLPQKQVYDDDADNQYAPSSDMMQSGHSPGNMRSLDDFRRERSQRRALDNSNAALGGQNGLTSIEGGGETTPRRRGHLRDALDEQPEPKSFSASDLANAEDEPDNAKASAGEEDDANNLRDGGFYNDSDSDSIAAKERSGSKKKKAALFGGGGIAAGGLIAFLIFIPAAKLNLMMEQLDKRSMTIAGHAVSDRVQTHVENYLKKKLLPKYKSCGNKISSACTVSSKNTLAGQLYDGWSQNRMEDKIRERFGIDITQNVNPGDGKTYFEIKNSKTGKPLHISEGELQEGGWLGKSLGKEGQARELDAFLKKETKWYQVMERHSINKWRKGKHNASKRCFLVCEAKKKIVEEPKLAVKKALIQHVVYPMSAEYGFVFECILNGGCEKGALKPSALEKIGGEEVDGIVAAFEKDPSKKLSQYIAEKLITKILEKLEVEGAETIGKQAADAIPVVGQIYLGLQIADFANEVWYGIKDHTVSKYLAHLNAQEYIKYYDAMLSAADEAKDGSLDTGEIAALVSEFNGAGESNVYQAYQPKNEVTTTLFGSKAYASSATENYKCTNDKPIPAGKLVCPEKTMAPSLFFEDWANSDYIKQAEPWFNTYELGCPGKERDTFPPTCIREFIHPALKKINEATGAAAKAAISGVEKGIEAVGLGDKYKEMQAFFKDKTSEGINWAVRKVFPMPVSDDSPARDKYDAAVAGSELTANEFGNGGYDQNGKAYGLGGKKLTDVQTAAILDEQKSQKEYERSRESFFARVFDTDSTDSVVGQAIMNSPTESSQFATMLIGSLQSIFSGKLFSKMFSTPFASAAISNPDVAVHSPFYVPKIGYAVDDPSAKIDPEELTPEKCAQYKSEWEASKTEDEATGLEEYTKTNPCLLDEVAIESAGMLYTHAFDDTSSSSNTPTESTSSSGGSSTIDPNLPSGSKEELIAKIKASGKVTNADKLDTRLHQTTLAVLLKLTEKYSFTLWQGAHRNDEAVDLGNINGKGVPTGDDYAAINDDASNFIRDAMTLIPNGNTWIGVSNDHFVSIGNEILKPKGGSVNLDLPSTTNARGAHFHIATPTGAP